MNINMGLSEYGRLRYMLRMADQLKLKKRLDKIKKKYPERTEQCDKEIAKV